MKESLPVRHITKPMCVKYKDKRYKKFKRQIRTKGYSPDELWGLDEAILYFILPRLKVFRKSAIHFKDWPDLPSGTYQKMIDEIIEGFELYLGHDGWIMEKDDIKKWNLAKKNFWDLFPSFWI